MTTAAPSKDRGRWAAAAFAALAAFAVFYPALRAGFINWDDDVNILDNPAFRGLGWAQLRWMFTTFHMGPYQPLTWLSWGLDYTLWGLRPFGYHLVNVLLHAANAALFFFLCRRLLAAPIPDAERKESDLDIAAFFAALVFALHPLRVESVAWVTERRDVLSGIFYLSAAIFYLRRQLAAALIFYACGLLSKAIGVTLPLVFLALDVYPLRRLPQEPRRWAEAAFRPVWFEKIPFLALALGAGLVGAAGQKHVRATLSLNDFGVLARVSQASYGLMFYAWKTLWPTGLVPLYEDPHPIFWHWPYWPSAAFVVLMTAFLVKVYRSWPAGLVAWSCYALNLLTVLGFVKFGQYLVADRYSYLACLSWAVLAGAGLLRLLRGRGGEGRRAVLGGAGALCAALSVLTWNQASAWYDSESLWKHSIAIDPRHEFMQNNLGTALAEKGKHEEAIPHYLATLAINPGSKNAHYNLGNSLYKLGRRREAIAAYLAALAVDGSYAQARNNLAVVLIEEGRPQEAIAQLEALAKLDPARPVAAGLSAAHNAMGIALAGQGRAAQALAEFQEAARLDPMNVGALSNAGAALADAGRIAEAVAAFQSALKVDPRSAQTHNSWGTALIKKGDAAGAAAHFRQALLLDPRLPDAHNNLAVVLSGQNKFDEAAAHYREALAARPDYVQAHFGLANILATQGKWADAAEHYRQTLRLDPGHDAARKNLELVLHHSGR